MAELLRPIIGITLMLTSVFLPASFLGGMIASTLLAVFFVPVFFVLSQHISEWRGKQKQPGQNTHT